MKPAAELIDSWNEPAVPEKTTRKRKLVDRYEDFSSDEDDCFETAPPPKRKVEEGLKFFWVFQMNPGMF